MLMRLELVTPAGDLVQAETYNKLFTMHGVIMIFFFLLPSIPAVLRELPRADHDRGQGHGLPAAQPALVVRLRRRRRCSRCWSRSWAASTPAGPSTRPTRAPTPTRTWSLTAMGVFITGFSSILTGLNFIVTIHKMRAPGLTWFRLPLFVWAHYATALIMVLGTPVLAITILLLALERLFHDRHLRPGPGRRPGALPALLLVLLPPGGLHHDPAGHGRDQRADRLLHAGSASSATASSPSRAWRSPCSASSSGATTCSSAASRSTPAWSSRRCRSWWRSLGDQGLQLDRDAVQGLDLARRRRCSTRSASSACSPSAA